MLGNWKKETNLLFEDDADRLRFLDRLGERVERFEIRLYLFTLMANYFHLVAETPTASLGRFMQSLSTAYTVYFNKRHRRHGHLLDGRYKAKLVEGDEYLLALTRYVHLNPVYTKVMVRRTLRERIEYLRRYRWSNYPGYIGRRKQFEFVDSGPVLADY
jgi:REP element-mobilizing transposase RayT